MTTNNRPVSIDRFIKLKTDKELEKSDVAAWYRTVCDHAAPGVTRTITVTKKNGKPTAVAVVHRVDGTDAHCYLVPLTRDLTDGEADQIVRDFVAAKPELDFDIETNVVSLNAPKNQRITLDAAKHLALCDAMAKQKHEDWMRERTGAGWRYGTCFNSEEKTHPLILPWDQLPDRYREPDMEWPQKLITLLNDQGYAVIDRRELDNLVTLLRSNGLE